MHRPPSPIVRVAAHNRALGAGLGRLDFTEVHPTHVGRVSSGREFRGMPGRPDHTVHIAVVDAVQWILPDFLFGRDLLTGDVRREEAVVVDMIEVISFLLGDNDLGQPLDHTATDVPWNEQAHGIPMVWMQEFAILHEHEPLLVPALF